MKKLIIAIVSINLLLAVTQLLLSAKRATGGDELYHVNQQLSRVRQQNQALKDAIYAKSSLTAIQQQAEALQLSKIGAQFINLSQPVAQAR